MPEPTPMGAHVEIVEPFTSGRGRNDVLIGTQDPLGRVPCIKPRRVRINGTDVGLIKKGSIYVDPGMDGEAATVTLTLYAKSIEIKAE
jgi:hypothetical protein